MTKFKIKKGDKVQVITGKDKGKVGEVLKVIVSKCRVIVSGVNVAVKHTKPSQQQEGGITRQELPVHISNVSHVDPKTNSITKVGYKLTDKGEKVRVAKKSGEIIGAKR